MFYLTLVIFISTGISSTKQYLDSGESGYLFVASFSLTFFVLAILKELFFVTYQKEIDLQTISKLALKPILFSNGKVFLEVKIGKKTRPIKLKKRKAHEIKKELESLMTTK